MHSDSSTADLDLKPDVGESLTEFEVPLHQVGEITFHYYGGSNNLDGISMKDRRGNLLFETFDDADREHTVSLEDGEVIVGFMSFTDNENKVADHFDFQLIVMRDLEADDLQTCECVGSLMDRVKPSISDA